MELPEKKFDNLEFERMWDWNHCHCLVHMVPQRKQVLMNLNPVYIKPPRLLDFVFNSSLFGLGVLSLITKNVLITNYLCFKIRLIRVTSTNTSIGSSKSPSLHESRGQTGKLLESTLPGTLKTNEKLIVTRQMFNKEKKLLNPCKRAFWCTPEPKS